MRRFLMTSLLPYGRAPRWQLWLFFLINLAIGAGWTALQTAYAAGDPRSAAALDHLGQNYLLYSVVYLAFVYVTLMTMINRYHDIGRSGWGLLWLALPIAVVIAAMTVASPNVAAKIGVDPASAKAASKALWVASWPLAVLLSLIVHVRCLLRPGEAADNRFGA